MSEDIANFKAAASGFENLFHEADAKIKKELWVLFVRGYKESYRNTKEVLKEDDAIQFYKKTVNLLLQCEATLNLELKEIPPKVDALYFGRAMGRLLGIFRFSLAQYRFNNFLDGRKEEIMMRLKSISNNLTKLNRKIDQKQIVLRLGVLAKEHAGEFSPRHKKFLAEAAAQFL